MLTDPSSYALTYGRDMLRRVAAIALTLAVACSEATAPATGPQQPATSAPETAEAPKPIARSEASESPRVEVFEFRSALLSTFAKADVDIVASVLTPPNFDPTAKHAIIYHVHGFGGTHRTSAQRYGASIIQRMMEGEAHPFVHVFLDATHVNGHHVFADSQNNGPWGTALVTEFLPAVDERYGGVGAAWGRFVTGHSSGGWSSLWLQVAYPTAFGGVWSTAPDPVDFRDFTGVDIYSFDNVYRDPSGEVVQLMRRRGEWSRSLQDYVTREMEEQKIGGQFYSFDAVFSPRGADGKPVPLFDRATGKIDPAVAEAWKAFDIALVLKAQWKDVAPDLRGKLHVIIGTIDTFRLEGAAKLLATELKSLGSDAEVLLVEGRDHGDLYAPHPEHYPKGLRTRIEAEAWSGYVAARDAQ